jgi:hypothetical protein
MMSGCLYVQALTDPEEIGLSRVQLSGPMFHLKDAESQADAIASAISALDGAGLVNTSVNAIVVIDTVSRIGPPDRYDKIVYTAHL